MGKFDLQRYVYFPLAGIQIDSTCLYDARLSYLHMNRHAIPNPIKMCQSPWPTKCAPSQGCLSEINHKTAAGMLNNTPSSNQKIAFFPGKITTIANSNNNVAAIRLDSVAIKGTP